MRKLLWGLAVLFLFGCARPTVWDYGLFQKDGNVVLDLTGVTFIFLGQTINISEMEGGTAVIAGFAGGRKEFGSSLNSFQSNYRNNMQIMRFRTNLVMIKKAGREVNINGQTFSLQGPKKTFLIPRTGKMEMRNFVASDAPHDPFGGTWIEPERLAPTKMTNNAAK